MTLVKTSGPDRPPLGVGFMVLFCALAPLADAMAKLLAETVTIILLLLARFAFQVAVLLPIAILTRKTLIWPRRTMALVAVRAALHVLGIGAMFLSLRYLPLADAIAIAYVMPFILLVLGHFLMGEDVGWRRVAACIIGFAGSLMVIQPSFSEVGPPALLPVLVAFVFAAFMLVTRKIAPETDPVALQVTGGGISLSMILPILVFLSFAPGQGPGIGWPEGGDWAIVVALGILGTLSHLVLTWSLRFAPASTVAPIQYLEIPMAALIGWMIFRDFPDGLALFGIAVTMAAGLFIVLRERALSRC